jgi:predicted DNA-binding protein (MmcQ/YjbR family)
MFKSTGYNENLNDEDLLDYFFYSACISPVFLNFSLKFNHLPNMDIDRLRAYCLSKVAVEESFPFGEDTLVFKVMEKAFVLAGLDNYPVSFNAKCDPEKALQLREEYPEQILPGWHMNKKHWNTIIIDGSLPEAFITELIDHSYDLVVKGLTKKQREALQHFE